MGRTPSSTDLDAKADQLRQLMAECNGMMKDLRAERAATISECRELLTAMLKDTRRMIDKAVNAELANLAEATQRSMKQSEQVIGERVEAALENIAGALADRLGDRLTEVYQRAARREGINARGRVGIEPDDMLNALTSDNPLRFDAIPVLPKPGQRGRPAEVPAAFRKDGQ
jgi:ABC-type transporter Mla subunit MlaD